MRTGHKEFRDVTGTLEHRFGSPGDRNWMAFLTCDVYLKNRGQAE